MCPKPQEIDRKEVALEPQHTYKTGALPQESYPATTRENSKTPSEAGSTPSHGPTGEPSLSERLGEQTVRLHQGLSTISASSFILKEGLPATFVALRKGPLDGYTVMLSCALTSSEYGELVRMLEVTHSMLGESVSVGVKFEPTTPNLVQPTTAPSTS